MAESSSRGVPFTRLGDYEVLAPISEGGMATIYLGRSSRTPGRSIALKVIRQEYTRDKQFVAMFLDEAKIASRLSHPNIVAIHELGHDGTRHFLAMELLRGRTLLEVAEAASAAGKAIPYEVVAWIGARIADALHHAHELRDEQGVPQNVVHRDVNPANVLLTYEGEPKVIDFGLAKARNRIAQTAVGVVKGKLAYLSPEQSHGRSADRRSDVFALGVTLWELSLGRRLFKADSDVETVRRVQACEVPDPAAIVPAFPRPLAEILKRALARDPDARYATAASFATALDGFVASTGKRVDASTVRALLSDLFASGDAPAWERLVADPGAAGDDVRIRAWDDDAQKMTWVAAQVETAPPAASTSVASVSEMPAGSLAEQLETALAERLATLDPAKEPLTTARAHLERALVCEVLSDASKVAEHARRSLDAAPTTAAHALLRRAVHARGAERELLTHLDAEIAACVSDGARADLLAERARLVDASGAEPDAIVEAWERVLAVAPAHPAALKGLEAALDRDPTRARYAEHLTRMADAWSDEPKLSAWLLVERARVLDRDLGQSDVARASLERALEIDGGLGPVRDAAVEHALMHRDYDRFVALVTRTAELERDPQRAARLELDAATIAKLALDHEERARLLLERAAARAPTSATVDRRVLDELAALHDSNGRVEDAARVLRRRAALVEDPHVHAHTLRSIALLEESLGRRDAAIEDLARARSLTPGDRTLTEEVDRLLASASRDEARVALWAEEAARATVATERARLLVRAAKVAESMADMTKATELLRAALVASPADAEAVDRLTRLLTTPASAATIEEARARIGVYAHAAAHEKDAARRVAYLESIALLEEQMLGDASLAAVTYESILQLEPKRRSAMIGLARTAARAGEDSRLARALLDEAALTDDPSASDALRVRAAEALAAASADRALTIVTDVLARAPSHAEARRLEQRLHETAGRWAKVDASLAARIEHASDPRETLDLWIARAELARTKLRAPKEALACLRAARAMDPTNAAVPSAIAQLLESIGDPQALRDGLVEIATGERGVERALLLVRAAELDELRLLDDERAAKLYEEALACAPDDAWLKGRLARVRARIDGATDADRPSDDDASPHALRTVERRARIDGALPRLANALARQADTRSALGARLAASWALLALIEWKLPPGDASDVALRILRDAPLDRAALDAMLRWALPRARQGDADARARALTAWRGALAHATDETDLALGSNALAIAIESSGGGPRDALAAYREALRIDPLSVVAALGTARLARATGDAEAAVAAAIARASLTTRGKRRASHLVEAAQKLLSTEDPRLGARSERLPRACELLERALDADPEAMMAAALLVTARLEEGNRDRLLATLRSALERATETEAIVAIGTELARVATTADSPDRVLAIDALRRVRSASPTHARTLRSLASLHVAQGTFLEAADALEALARAARDPAGKLAALFELADIYRTTLARPAEVERVLRAALDIDPANVRALRELLLARRAATADASEIAGLLTRLGDVETTPEAKSAAWLELAALREVAGDRASAEAALIEATALAPHAASLARLLRLHENAPSEQARTLAVVVTRAHTLGRADAACLAALGQLEIEPLGRYGDAIGHLRAALAIAPAMHEARAALARALVGARAGSDATATLVPMMVPDASPLLSLRDPGAALRTLEHALALEGRREEAIVAREISAIAGSLDDGAHVELRARRLPTDASTPPALVFDPTTFHGHVVPPEARAPLLQVAVIVGSEEKLVRTELTELGITPRDRIPASSGHPLSITLLRVARMFGLERPELVISDQVPAPQVAIVQGAPWVLVPESVTLQPEPVQLVEVTRMVARIATGAPWLPDLGAPAAHALLCAALRVALPDFARELPDAAQRDRVEDEMPRVSRALGRRQKKAIAELAPHLSAAGPPSLAHIDALLTALARTEARAAIVVSGDLLATLDALRNGDSELARATSNVGRAALAALLAHPVAGDAARFALGPTATALRWRAGALWTARG